MEINDEHRAVEYSPPLLDMASASPSTSIRHVFHNGTGSGSSSSGGGGQLLLLSGNPYHWNSSGLEALEPVYNITEANIINFWNRVNTSLSRHFTNDSTSTALTVDLSSNSTIVAFNNTFELKDPVLTWWDVWSGKPFPSGYTQLAIVLLAFFLTCIMILVVVGNMLVCIAIATEKSLKPVQNWFIASLAVSDFLIGLVIMPFSLARELMGYWMFGQVWCDVHAALDVLLCTASINSLFLISLDRYWSITQAVKYLKKRTPSRAAFMIAFVWVFSALVSLPPLVGWKKAEQSSEYPQCNLSEDIGYVLYSSIGSFYFPALMMVFVYARIFIAARSRARKHLEKKRLKMPVEVHTDTIKDKSTTTTFCTSFSNPSPPENPNKPAADTTNTTTVAATVDLCAVASDKSLASSPTLPSIQVNITEANVYRKQNSTASSLDVGATGGGGSGEDLAGSLCNKSPPPPQIIIEPTPESRRQSWNIISTSELISSINVEEMPECRQRDRISPTSHDDDDDNKCSSTNQKSEPLVESGGRDDADDSETTKSKSFFPRFKTSARFRFRKPKLNGLNKNNSLSKSETVDDDSDTADSPTNKDAHHSYESKAFLSAPKLLRSKFGSSLSIADYEDSDIMEEERKKGGKGRVQYHDPPVVGIHIPSDAERHKRKIAKARERRATLIVGLIMAAFITAWLPFFMLYVLAALCVSCKETIPEGVFAVAFWLGYCNSAANPIIYTIFNRDYRKAFRKILFK